MKKVVLALMILALASPVFAADAYVGLYADVGHSVCSWSTSGMFTVYPFFNSHLGVQAAEYKLTAPSSVFPGSAVNNPNVSASLGDPWAGIAVSFGFCQEGWVWTQAITCMLFATTPGFITVGPSPTAGALQIASCELGYPKYAATVINHLAINQGCEIAAEESTWGAIKSLF